MTSNTLKLRILSPETIVFEAEVLSVSLPGSLSPFQVLPNHGAIISSLSEGVIKIKDIEAKETEIRIQKGVVRVLNNQVEICI